MKVEVGSLQTLTLLWSDPELDLWPAQEELMRAPQSRSFGGNAGEQR